MKYISKNKGITLVALVITIVILIILAGIGISTLSGQNGLITKTLAAKKTMIKESIRETVQRRLVEKQIDSYNGNSDPFEDSIVNELRNNNLIDDDTKIIDGFVVLDDENVISLSTGDDAVIGNSSEWEYMIYDANYTINSITTGKSDENVTSVNYTIQEEGNENNKVAGIVGYKGSSTEIVIPEFIVDNNEVIPVTRLGDRWASNQNFATVNVSKIKIMDNIKMISHWVFSENTHIESISIGNGVEFIGDGAFHKCSSLNNVTLGKNLKYIGHDAFKETDIENIDFPNSLVLIGSKSFEKCTKIKNLSIENGITTLGYACFRECTGLESIQFNSVMEEISEECFAFDNNLKEINIPSNIKIIAKQAFMYVGHKYDDTGVGYVSNIQPKLERIILKEGLQEIGYEAFTGAKSVKENLRLPASVTTIETNAFLDFGSSGGGLLYKSDGTLY